MRVAVIGVAAWVPSVRAFAFRDGLRSRALSMSAEVQKRVLVPIADGSEEIEFSTIANTLVRGGAKVTVASVGPDLQVTGSRGIKLVADCPIGDCEGKEWDLVACPGGMPGATHLHDSPALCRIIKQATAAGKKVAAICAAPAVVLSPLGVLEGRKATGYPAPRFIDALASSYVAGQPVIVDGNIITSQGPATALPFALKLVGELFGAEKAQAVATEMLHGVAAA
ncbi:unnamed protein product [Phaeothamnion confervicola]